MYSAVPVPLFLSSSFATRTRQSIASTAYEFRAGRSDSSSNFERLVLHASILGQNCTLGKNKFVVTLVLSIAPTTNRLEPFFVV